MRAEPVEVAREFEMRGDRAVPRIWYEEPHLEIMSPSKNHEVISSIWLSFGDF